jgi:hypothetical protein
MCRDLENLLLQTSKVFDCSDYFGWIICSECKMSNKSLSLIIPLLVSLNDLNAMV